MSYISSKIIIVFLRFRRNTAGVVVVVVGGGGGGGAVVVMVVVKANDNNDDERGCKHGYDPGPWTASVSGEGEKRSRLRVNLYSPPLFFFFLF